MMPLPCLESSNSFCTLGLTPIGFTMTMDPAWLGPCQAPHVPSALIPCLQLPGFLAILQAHRRPWELAVPSTWNPFPRSSLSWLSAQIWPALTGLPVHRRPLTLPLPRPCFIFFSAVISTESVCLFSVCSSRLERELLLSRDLVSYCILHA